MFPPKKKPAIGVMIGLGDKGDSGPSMPPKYKSQPDSGDGGAGEMPSAPKPPSPKPPMASMPPAAHESAETPAHEGGEEYGAKLVADIDSVFDSAGIDPQQGRQIASQLFAAVAKCLGGKDEAEGSAMDMGDGGASGGGGY